jgi:hypothetical protein
MEEEMQNYSFNMALRIRWRVSTHPFIPDNAKKAGVYT